MERSLDDAMNNMGKWENICKSYRQLLTYHSNTPPLLQLTMR